MTLLLIVLVFFIYSSVCLKYTFHLIHSLRKTVYLHGPLPPHPDAKSRNENDAKTTAMTITVDFFKESIAVFKEVRKKIYQT